MDAKIAMLFILFAVIIGLSHLDNDSLARLKKPFSMRRRRTGLPARSNG